MREVEEADLNAALAGLDVGMHVGYIAARALQTCGPDQAAAAVLSDQHLRGYDYLPVVGKQGYMGVLKRTTEPLPGAVRDHMLPLSDRMLVAANMPMLDFIPLLGENPFWLVVFGSRIDGIVTRSDLLKLPVRICVFTLVTHLELVMMNRIRTLFADEVGWFALLSPNRGAAESYLLHAYR